MPEEFYDADFPQLRLKGWARTSEPANYNCIAFAVGDYSRYWWPNLDFPEPSDDYWPVVAPNEETIEAFVAAFASRSFVKCDNDLVEPGFDKIALYALNHVPTHAARQQSNGKWRSKLGPHEDIETTLDGLVGPLYGAVVEFMKRPME